MPAAVALSGAPWRVTPGETAEVAVMVRNTGNTGTTVDHFSVEVVGSPAAWSTVEPPLLPLLPNMLGLYSWEAYPFGRVVGLRIHVVREQSS